MVRRCLLEPLGVGADLHAFVDGGHAGGKELVAALDLDQAQAAGAHVAEAVQMAEGGNVDVVLPRHFKDGLAGAGADFLLVDDESFDVCFGAHANTSTAGLNVADASRTALVHNVLDVLVPEVLERAQHRDWAPSGRGRRGWFP